MTGRHPNNFNGQCLPKSVALYLLSDLYMGYYYVNKNIQKNGDHEVHKPGCSFMPKSENRMFLGEFPGCRGAVVEAKKYYLQSNGCYYCCNTCHTQ